ncbi:MAG: OmpH family outer membrane protein [Acidobacteriota bacterium]|nr:MAG: OmpH family outer membrane protein [Acidobacteriota bacterium]
MNRISRITLASLVMLLAFSGIALAQGGAKIGFVNSQEVLYGTNEGKEGLERLDQFMASKRTEFEARNKELSDLQSDFQTKQRTLNSDALMTMERNIQVKQRELQRFEEDTQADFNQRQNAMLQGMSAKVQAVIEEFAQQNSYVAIFMRDNTQAYVSPALDVTQQIIVIYNEKHPGSGTAAATPAPAQ